MSDTETTNARNAAKRAINRAYDNGLIVTGERNLIFDLVETASTDQADALRGLVLCALS